MILCLYLREHTSPLPHTQVQREHKHKRHTAAGTAAPTTTHTENTVPQRAKPHSNDGLYAHLQKRGPRPRSALGHVDAGPSNKISRCAYRYSTQWYPRELSAPSPPITVQDNGLPSSGFLPPRRAGGSLPLASSVASSSIDCWRVGFLVCCFPPCGVSPLRCLAGALCGSG